MKPMTSFEYWARLMAVLVLSVIVGTALDILLGVEQGSGRDWLLWFTSFSLLGYYFWLRPWVRRAKKP